MTSAATDLSDFLSDVGTDRDGGGVASFGDPAEESRALREGAGLVWRADQRAYRVGGAERGDFLHRLLTADIKGLTAGSCRTSLLLDNKGRTQVAFEIGATDDEFVAAGTTPQVDVGMETLARYVLRSDVEITVLDAAVLSVTGPAADAVVGAAELTTLENSPMAFRGGRGWLLVAAAPRRVWQRLTTAGAVPVGLDAAEGHRVALGQAGAGSEITGSEFPQELRLDAAIDFDKGCYLGQETVARIHYRGQVNRLLCVLACDVAVQVGEALLVDGKGVGRITSVTTSSDVVALALVARDHSDVGTALTTDSGAVVTVVEATGGQ